MQKRFRLLTSVAYAAKRGFGREKKETKPNFDGLRGITNGDDALAWNDSFVAIADGVGQWHKKPGGKPSVWSRLLLHHLTMEMESRPNLSHQPQEPIEILQAAYIKAFRQTVEQQVLGTTTAILALVDNDQLRVVNVGDSRCYVIRDGHIIYRSEDQWHWFDCPAQLGTNSNDTPSTHGVLSNVAIQNRDIVVLGSDGLSDNLFDAEILEIASSNVRSEGTTKAAKELLERAQSIAWDPDAESPYLERYLREFDTIRDGGKPDDISVIVSQIQNA